MRRYIVGPPNINDEKLGTGKTMKVYLASSEKGTEFTLVVYRALSATICMLLNGTGANIACRVNMIRTDCLCSILLLKFLRAIALV